MSTFLPLILMLSAVITAAKLGGYLSLRAGQPAVLGELLVGILLGPTALNILGWPVFSAAYLPETIRHLAEIGVLLLMFLAGMDLHITDLLNSSKVAGLAGSLGVIFPLILGAGVGLLFGMDLSGAIFAGLILSATSVSISAQTLMELKVLRSKMGVGLLGAAVFDDILVILGLSIFSALTQPGSGGWLQVVWVVIRMALYLAMATLLGWGLFPRLSRMVSRLPISQGLVSLALVILFFFGWSAEALGQMAAITGAFFAGLWLGHTAEKERIRSGISSIAYALFVPVFFIQLGLTVDARSLLGKSGLLLLVMLLVAIAGKVAGAGLGARWGGLTTQEALQLGVGMISRGEVGLIVASIGLSQGLINAEVFTAVMGVVVFTTLLTPPMLRTMFSQTKPLPKQPLAQTASARPQPDALPGSPSAIQTESEPAAPPQSEPKPPPTPADTPQTNGETL